MSKNFTFHPDTQTYLMYKKLKICPYRLSEWQKKEVKKQFIANSLGESIMKNQGIFKIWDIFNNAFLLHFNVLK